MRPRTIVATGATVVASANPGCSMQIAAELEELGSEVEVVHPIQLVDRAGAIAPAR